MASVFEDLCDSEKGVFDCISRNDVGGLKTILLQPHLKADIFDDHGMTPLQHAAYKGNKEIAQILLDQGADVNSGRHEHGYTALHFAALSSNAQLCQMLLAAGAKSHPTNSVGRTPSQMAAFVGNHACVAAINNFVPKSDVDYYTVPQGLETEPKLPPVLASPLHKFIMQVTVHPVRIALNLLPSLIESLCVVQRVLSLMSDREMRHNTEANEVMSFKLHFLASIVGELAKSQQPEKPSEIVEQFARKVLKSGRGEEYVEMFVRDCVREFPHRECTIFRQMVNSLARGGTESVSALNVVATAINGIRGFPGSDTVATCAACGEEGAVKKCSKCKMVQYCDRECQRLHWFAHKKACARPSTVAPSPLTPPTSQLHNLKVT